MEILLQVPFQLSLENCRPWRIFFWVSILPPEMIVTEFRIHFPLIPFPLIFILFKTLVNDSLTGSLPSEIGNLSLLKELWLGECFIPT